MDSLAELIAKFDRERPEDMRIAREELKRRPLTSDDFSCVDITEVLLRHEIARLRDELETERMRLVACSVISLANTPESAASAREMHPDYQSPSCDDVARAIDREMALRAELVECRAKHMDDLLVLGETAKAERELRAELAECKDLLRIASDFVERLPGHEGRTAFTDRIDAALREGGGR